MARYSVLWAVPMWTELIAVLCVATLRYCDIVICHETCHFLLFTGHLPGKASGKIFSSVMLRSSPTSPMVKSLWYWKQETYEIKNPVKVAMKQIHCKFAIHIQMQWHFCLLVGEQKIGRNVCHVENWERCTKSSKTSRHKAWTNAPKLRGVEKQRGHC